VTTWSQALEIAALEIAALEIAALEIAALETEGLAKEVLDPPDGECSSQRPSAEES
jgi:hypothetical protein